MDDLERAVAGIRSTLAGREAPNFFDDPDNHFGDLAREASLPLNFPELVQAKMTPMEMVLLPANEVRSIIDDDGEWSLPVAAMLDTHLRLGASGVKVVRFGGRTPHDSGSVTARKADHIKAYLRGSERAMLEAWAWCPRYGYLPLTIHDHFGGKFMEFRLHVVDHKIVAASNSMNGNGGHGPREQRTWYNSLVECMDSWLSMKQLPNACWLDVGIDSHDWRIFDVNPDEGMTWPGWNPNKDDERALHLVGGHASLIYKFPLNKLGRAMKGMETINA